MVYYQQATINSFVAFLKQSIADRDEDESIELTDQNDAPENKHTLSPLLNVVSLGIGSMHTSSQNANQCVEQALEPRP